jgi:undecaprenyl-diphosphatase
MDKFIGDNLENFTIIGAALVVGGVAMWIIDRVYSSKAKTQTMDEISVKQAIAIGCTQILAATFPGVSRSMATIAGGQIMGLSRTAALEFSFFLSIPVMISATGFKLLQYILKESSNVQSQQWQALAIGFVVSFFVAWAVIAWFMSWVTKHGFAPFAIYRLIAGAAVLIWLT